MTNVKGYEYGSKSLQRPPYSLEDLELLKKAVMFMEDDEKYLRMAGKVLEDQIDNILNLWYSWVASNQHLVHYFSDEGGKPLVEYLESVRLRFGQWVRDLCNRTYDQDWLTYQYEIALRHHKTKRTRPIT